jgi:AraC-like DNA-binding protein
LELGDAAIDNTVAKLKNSASIEEWVNLITHYLIGVFVQKQERLDTKIKEALLIIIENRGQVSMTDVCRDIDVNKRTFERRFAAETGLLPKQFAKIIQFQSSLEQLTENDYDKLTDIVYENGFSDQSHFIKVFKAYTGKTPKAFSKI